METKTTMNYHLTPVRMPVIKKEKKLTSVGDSRIREALMYTVGRNANW